MATIGNLANAASETFNLSYLPQFLQIGDPDNADTLSSMTVTARGKTLIQLSDSAQIRAIMQTETEVIAAGANTELGSRLMLADGRIEGQSTVTILNGGATTTAVYENSLGLSGDGMARKIAVTPIVANGQTRFSGFDLLLFLPTNFDRAQVTYMNGYTEELSAAELQALYLSQFPAEASGLINGFIAVAGLRGETAATQVATINLFAGSGGNCDVVVSNWGQIAG